MTQVLEDETDPDGYMNTSHTGNVISEEIYTDMESGSDQYVDVALHHTYGRYVSTSHVSVGDDEELYINLNEDPEELYEPMTDNTGEGTTLSSRIYRSIIMQVNMKTRAL